VSDIADELGSDYEFVYASGGYGDMLSSKWIPDPDMGKPTTDADIASDSVENLDAILDDEGPFYGIMGFGQGAAFTAVYLSLVPADTFEMAVMFCGYLPEMHLGLLDVIDDASPFDDIPALVWMGGADLFIPNDLSYELAGKFTDPVVVYDADAGFIVPGASEDTFDSVVEFILTKGVDTDDGSDDGGECADSTDRVEVFIGKGTVMKPCAFFTSRNGLRFCDKEEVYTACPVSCDTCDDD